MITEKKPNEEEPANQFLVGVANFFMLFSKLSINDGKEEEKKAMVVEPKNGLFLLVFVILFEKIFL